MFKKCVEENLFKNYNYNLPSYLQTLALYHILNPNSKSKCMKWYQHSYMQYLVDLPVFAFHKNNIYEYMDRIYNKRHKIFRSLRDSAISSIGIEVSELIFDTTSIFFRVAELTAEDNLRKRGYSRDKRPDLIQVVIALCTNSDGFPLYFRSYPGNTSDFHAFKNFLHDFDSEIKPIYGDGVVWVIFDKGNTSKKTIQKLDKLSNCLEGSYLAYIAAIRLNKSLLAELKHAETCMVEEKKYMVSETFIEQYGGVKRVLIVYDPKLKDKQVTKLEKKYQNVKSKLEEILQSEKDTVKRISKMSEVIRKNKLNTVFCVEADGDLVTYQENKSAKKKLFMRARTFAILTNNFTCERNELIAHYLGRNRVEQTFRDLKHEIPIRPVYHWLKRRIKTHVFIVMVGYLLLSALKIHLQKNGLDYTIDQLLFILRSGYVDIIDWNESVSIEYPKNISPDLLEVFDRLDISLLNF